MRKFLNRTSLPITSASVAVRFTGTLGIKPHHKNPKIVVTGSLGQIGTNLVQLLRADYGNENVIATDIRLPKSEKAYKEGPFCYCSALDKGSLARVIVDNDIDWIVHLGAIMSVMGEAMPGKTLDLNVDGVRNVLDAARDHNLRCFIPSTMAVFGPSAGKNPADDCILQPTTVYGCTKVFLELLGSYYHAKWGVDFRSVRYPGIISPETLPGGGTTDYAVHMYHQALKKKHFLCPVSPNEALPMMYIDDCLAGTTQLLKADRKSLTRCCYNLAGMSFTPKHLEESIVKKVPGFAGLVKYEVGLAQQIAASWPDAMDDSNAKKDWGWNPQWDLDRMTAAMLSDIPKYHAEA